MLSVLAQRAASEGPRWTRAVESTPVTPSTYSPLAHLYGGTLIKNGKARRAPVSLGNILSKHPAE